jgi:hypothetical protein
LTFEDGRPGTFIDKSQAVVVTQATAVVPTAFYNPHLTSTVRPAVVRDNVDHDMVFVANTSNRLQATEGRPRLAPPTRQGLSSDAAESNMTELSRLLDHMAFTAATLISSNAEDPDMMSKTLADFQAAVRDNTRLISQQRRNRNQGIN